MMKTCTAGVLVLITAACQKPTAAPQADSATTRRNTTEQVDIWTRSRQCADDSERLATRLQREAAPYQKGPKVMGWSNHYNRKDGRCYVEIAYYNASAERDAPRYYRELHDAVEGLLLAMHANGRFDEVTQAIWCMIPDPNDPRGMTGTECPTAQKFITDRMTN